MNRMMSIFLFSVSLLFSDATRIDRSHLIVTYDGATIPCMVDSFTVDYAYFIPKDSVDTDSMHLKDIYFIYNDFDRMFFQSWSFDENLRRMNNRSGMIHTLSGDSIPFTKIEFNANLINPEVFINQGNDNSNFMPMLSIRKIETDFSIMEYAVKRGFNYSITTIFFINVLKMRLQWDKGRRFIPQTWDTFNDVLPQASLIGLPERGVTYETVVIGIPLFILGNMAYDYWMQKNQFYFSPIYEETQFGRNMYVFSFKNIIRTYSKIAYHKLIKIKSIQKVIRIIKRK